MCLAPLALKYKEIVINDPKVVKKSYPDFWKDIQQTGIVTVDKI
jgi:3-phosphoshikimate 1-carboxyvinyltransferase